MFCSISSIKNILSTEKAFKLKEAGYWVFEVSRTATKNDIKQAMKLIYDIVPDAIKTLNVKRLTKISGGKTRRTQYKLLTMKKVYVKFPVGFEI